MESFTLGLRHRNDKDFRKSQICSINQHKQGTKQIVKQTILFILKQIGRQLVITKTRSEGFSHEQH